jgi:enamine deaminase RidA (YjgF/YER057c/UK114 family)
MAVERHGSGAPWEAAVGYSRVVRAGDLVLVAGTTATMPDGAIAGLGDAYLQTRQAIENVSRALAQVGATPADVVRTRIYVTDITAWEEVGRAHAEAFGDVRPVTAMVEVSALLDPRMLVELEVEAWVGDGADSAGAGAR